MYFNVSLDTFNCPCIDDMSSRVLVMRSLNLKLISLSTIRQITWESVGKSHHYVNFEFKLDMGFRGPKCGPKVPFL